MDLKHEILKLAHAGRFYIPADNNNNENTNSDYASQCVSESGSTQILNRIRIPAYGHRQQRRRHQVVNHPGRHEGHPITGISRRAH